MIRFQIVERKGADLYKSMSKAMREGDLRTLVLEKRGTEIVHRRYPGRIRWAHARGVIDCRLSSGKPESEWQLFRAIMGRLAGRYADSIAAIHVEFPDQKRPRPSQSRRRRTRGRRG